MPPASLARLLERLNQSPSYSVARFDDGPSMRARVAILPSAFNPPTLAHLHLLETTREVPGVSSVAALLTTRNVDKPVFGATLEQRIEMLLALAHESAFAVLAANAARLVDQGSALRRCLPGLEFDFVTGYDTLVRLFDQRYYTDMRAELEPFFEHHRVIATNRAHHSLAEVEGFVGGDAVASRFLDRIVIREIGEQPASLSSTAARRDAAQGIDHPHLPGPVARYVRRHRLYQPGDAQSPGPADLA